MRESPLAGPVFIAVLKERKIHSGTPMWKCCLLPTQPHFIDWKMPFNRDDAICQMSKRKSVTALRTRTRVFKTWSPCIYILQGPLPRNGISMDRAHIGLLYTSLCSSKSSPLKSLWQRGFNEEGILLKRSKGIFGYLMNHVIP